MNLRIFIKSNVFQIQLDADPSLDGIPSDLPPAPSPETIVIPDDVPEEAADETPRPIDAASTSTRGPQIEVVDLTNDQAGPSHAVDLTLAPMASALLQAGKVTVKEGHVGMKTADLTSVLTASPAPRRARSFFAGKKVGLAHQITFLFFLSLWFNMKSQCVFIIYKGFVD